MPGEMNGGQDSAAVTASSDVGESVRVNQWLVVYPNQMGRETETFVRLMRRVGEPHNFNLPNPKM